MYNEHMGSLMLWWKFGELKKFLLAGRGALYDAQSTGNKRPLTLVHILTVKDTHYTVAEVATGSDAWSLIEADPDAINANLVCGKCGFSHVIRAQFYNGAEKLTSCAFGSFEGNQGRWHAEWFDLHSLAVKDFLKDDLICRSCKSRSVPTVHLY